MQFFVRYGSTGMAGCLMASFLFALCGAILMFYIHKHFIDDYQAALGVLLGEKLGRVMDILVSVFLFLGIGAMLSAAGAIAYEHLFWPKEYGVLAAYAGIAGLLFQGKNGLIRSFNIFVPAKLTLLLIVGVGAIFQSGPYTAEISAVFLYQGNWNWILPGLLYVAYNFVLAMVILIEYKPLASARNAVIGAGIGGLLLGILLLVNYLALSHYLPATLHYEVPMLYVSGHVSPLAKKLFMGVLLIGILTTALANTHGLSARIQQFTGLNYRVCLVLILTLALPLGMFNFSLLVNIIYPILGFLGLVIVGALLVKGLCDLGRNLL
jgi:uncharacterized membrane protein YkvI